MEVLEKRFLDGDYTPFSADNKVSEAGKENASPGVMVTLYY